MVVLEEDVGIRVFLGDHSGFRGVVKQRFSDFIVHEVRLDGSIVRLTDLSAPEPYSEPVPSTEEALESLESILPGATGEVCERSLLPHLCSCSTMAI